MRAYSEFISSKSQSAADAGFAPVFMPDSLFDFQAFATDRAIRKGRYALYEDCGLGKTLQELVWAENVYRHTNRPVLISTPLAVAAQTIREGEKFGIPVHNARNGDIKPGINVANYERLHYFKPSDFAGAVGDEASAIKAFDGKRRKEVTRFYSKLQYRLLATATAAPNDFIELGTASEALGVMTQSDMLGEFFRSSDRARHSLFKEGDFWNRQKYFFRAHAELPFWRWVCSWSLAIRKPSDIGFDDGRFILPELIETQHVIPTTHRFPGELFVRVARTLNEQRQERRRSIQERCEKVAELADHGEPVVVWCQYNEEGDFLEKLIPGAVQVAGRHTDDEKESRLTAFTVGDCRVLITKGKIGALGLNWQHCGHQIYFPSHSWEQYYQGVRRSLRFGRVGPVRIDIVATEGEAGVMANLQKKQRKADEMFARLTEEMNRAAGIVLPDRFIAPLEIPSWL